jgi:hypothetical protein
MMIRMVYRSREIRWKKQCSRARLIMRLGRERERGVNVADRMGGG